MILFRYLLFVFAVLKCHWFVSGSTITQQQKLAASDGTVEDYFGVFGALDGDTAVVGAYLGDYKGSVYVFVRSGTTWTQQQKLIANDGASSDWFGGSVALDGDTLVVGAYRDDDKGYDSGSVYVFVRSGTTWSQQQKLVANDGAAKNEFGDSVALDGDTLVVGAYGDDDNGDDSGSVYVFVRSGTTWSQQQKLVANDGVADHRFGNFVALDGDTLVVGAYDSENASTSGSVYVFVRSGTTWSQQQKFVGSQWFGAVVTLDGDTLVVGDSTDDDNGSTSGSVYIYVRSGTTWSQQQKLVASDGVAGDTFGVFVALDGDTAVVGAYGDDGYKGSVYVFALPPSSSGTPPPSDFLFKSTNAKNAKNKNTTSNIILQNRTSCVSNPKKSRLQPQTVAFTAVNRSRTVFRP